MTLETFKHSGKVIDATTIHEIDRELTLYEIAQMTRARPGQIAWDGPHLRGSWARDGRECGSV